MNTIAIFFGGILIVEIQVSTIFTNNCGDLGPYSVFCIDLLRPESSKCLDGVPVLET